MTSKANFPSLGNNFKRKRQSIDVARQQNYNLDFLMPNYEDELALHPKKLEELKQWLITKMSVVRGNKMLLLTGPSGSGKKTAVKVICSELGIEVTEWDWEDEYGLDQFRERVIRRPSLTSFVQFLQDGEFTSIQRMTLKHRLLLISQLPSTLLREKKYLHEILTAIGPRSRCMIVFVLPNVDACWELSPVRIFPPSIMDALGISHIKFNSISPTFLTGAVKRAIKMLNITHLGAEDIRSISSSANGNIWQAMNSLLFLKNGRKTVSTDFTSKRPRRLENGRSHPHALASSFTGSSSSSSAASLKLALASMPEQLELFHFIGKVLYAKRAEKSSEAWNRVEAKLNPQVWSKIALPLPPKDELNGLIDRSPLSAQMLAGFVFENEPHFAPSVQAAARMANTMAQLDGMVESNFEQRSTMEKYMLDLTIRGSILHNYRSHLAANPKRRFYQFEKPKFREIDEQRRENRLRIAQLFPTERSSEAALLNLPIISRIQSICVHRSQYELLKRLSLSQQSNHFRVQLMNNTASGIGQPLQLESDQEFISELAMLEEADGGMSPLSPNASMDSFYSISSNITEMEQQNAGNDGFNYDIEEVEDEVDEEARMEL